MPLMQWREFRREIEALVTIYRDDNRWVGTWRNASWNNDHTMYLFQRAAYRLYEATGRNELRYVLLGGTGIRMSRELILNFGVTSANGIQDAPTVGEVDFTNQARRGAAAQPRPQAAANPDDRVIPAQGFGSILSEKDWTPILNDALIVGSVSARHEFMLALEPKERGIFRESEASVRTALHKRRPGAMLGPEEWRDVWLKVFRGNIGMFWDVQRNIPRVLARELVGLSIFGYRVKLTGQGVGFEPPGNDVPDPTFANYVQALRRIGFHRPGARARIMREISGFLVNDDQALCFTADRPANAGRPHVGNQVRFV